MKTSEIVSLLVVLLFLSLVGVGSWVGYRIGGWALALGVGVVLFFVLGTFGQMLFRKLNRKNEGGQGQTLKSE
jgi:hypothetical protein